MTVSVNPYDNGEYVIRGITTIARKRYNTRDKNPWLGMITPILNHKKFTDDMHNQYVFVEEKFADNRATPNRKWWGTYGQIMLKCITDGTYWRIGFVDMDKKNEKTLPDDRSHYNDRLLFLQYDYVNKKPVKAV